jgi:hypothetical protein
MKTYNLEETDFGLQLTRTDPNGQVWSIPMIAENSDYAEYLRYTAWVEAGNNPDEFWTQSEGGI